MLMTCTSLVLGLMGVIALFAPEMYLSLLDATVTGQFSLLVQLMGALYFAFALMNWTAKDSAIGGIYARPISLGNFGHFFVGALLLIRHQLSNPLNVFMVLGMIVYMIFAFLFYWLVFRATGLPVETPAGK
jgi:hypothetical protein